MRGGTEENFPSRFFESATSLFSYDDNLIAKRNCTSFLTRERSMENNFHVEILHVNIFF